MVERTKFSVGDLVIIQEEAPCVQWPLRKIIASMDKQSLVRTFKVLMGTKTQTKRPSIIKRAVQKVVLLFEATERE